MDKLNNYRAIIKQTLNNLANYGSSPGRIDEYAVCDETTDNYILSNVGWHPSGRRQLGYPVHVRIKDQKVWVEWDGTDQEIIQQLIDAGIDENDIVLGWDNPEEFRYSELKAA